MAIGTKLYVMRGEEFTKIGISMRVYSRAVSVNSAVPFDVSVIMISCGGDAAIRRLERKLKDVLPGHVKGEWFRTSCLPYDLLRGIVISSSIGRGVSLLEGDAVGAIMDAERAADKERDAGLMVASRWQVS